MSFGEIIVDLPAEVISKIKTQNRRGFEMLEGGRMLLEVPCVLFVSFFCCCCLETMQVKNLIARFDATPSTGARSYRVNRVGSATYQRFATRGGARSSRAPRRFGFFIFCFSVFFFTLENRRVGARSSCPVCLTCFFVFSCVEITLQQSCY